MVLFSPTPGEAILIGLVWGVAWGFGLCIPAGLERRHQVKWQRLADEIEEGD